MVVNDGDVGIWCSLGKNVFVSILWYFLSSPLWGLRTRSDGGVRGHEVSVLVFSGHPGSMGRGNNHFLRLLDVAHRPDQA